MEIKEKLQMLIEKIIGIIVDTIFKLGIRYPNSVFGKFVYLKKRN